VTLGAGCEVRNLAVVGSGATLGVGNELDHGLRVGAGQTIPDNAVRFS
jgi:carbonic anhydrase/acetyltransferase-like protein (isoleucine patch superfamily)